VTQRPHDDQLQLKELVTYRDEGNRDHSVF
jgi:hypothetical protein